MCSEIYAMITSTQNTNPQQLHQPIAVLLSTVAFLQLLKYYYYYWGFYFNFFIFAVRAVFHKVGDVIEFLIRSAVKREP